jgi:hypothetical protein
MAIPTYEIFIDWDNDGGLDVGNFELGTDDWVASTAGPPTVATDTAQAHMGTQSLKITWTGAASQFVSKTMTGLVSGRQYTLSAWVFVGSGDQAVRMDMGGTNGTASAVTNQWTKITVTHTATSSEHTIQIEPSATPTNGDIVYMDQVMVTGPGEDVSGRVLGGRAGIDLSYGRDTARSLAEFSPGEMGLTIDNTSQDYSPDNTGSPLFGYVVPGRNIIVRATYNSKSYTLFNGFVDDYRLLPERAERALEIVALDVLQKLNEATISTELYRSIQTGEAIERVLDAVNWPADKRSIDQGSTTIRWWWEEEADAFEALNKIVAAEGPPSITYVDAQGNFVFRSRHHRLLRAASTDSQATFTGGDGPIEFVAAGTAFSDTAAGTSYTLNKPAGVQAEDLMIAFVFSDAVATNTEPSGWREVRTITLDDGTDDCFLSILVKDVASSDPSSWAGSISVSSSRRYARVLAYRGAASADDQFVNENQATSTGTSATLTTATLVGGQPGNWRVAAFLAHENETNTGWGSYTPTQTTERFDAEVGGVDPVLALSVADSGGTVSPTSDKTMTATLSGTTGVDSSASWIGLIRPYEGEGLRFEEEGFEYDIGWKDIVNSISFTIEERDPTFRSVVFDSEEEVIIVPASSTKEIIVESDEPFYDASVPVEDTDYEVIDGEVTVTLDRTSGASCKINLTAGVNQAVVRGLRLRAIPVPVKQETIVKREDTSSISNHGIHSIEDDIDASWLNKNDAEAVAETILGLRAERLPLITFKISNSNDAKTTNILSRDLSDRIHIVENETFTDHDFFIERIEQNIEDVGYNHSALFGCERTQTQVDNVFTFGVAGQGFDQGRLGLIGADSADTIMILGTGTLDNNVLGT